MNERQSRSPLLERGTHPMNQPGKASTGVGETISEAASSVAEKAQDAWDATKHQAEQLGKNVADTASNLADELTTLIRRHPGSALAMGLAIGFLAGVACDRAIR